MNKEFFVAYYEKLLILRLFSCSIYIRKRRDKDGVIETAEWLHLYYGRQKNFVRNLRSIFRCQKKGCIAFNFKRDVSSGHAWGKGN